MARTKPQPVEMSTLVGGIITEANPLTFPANASLDEQNMVVNRDGSRQRRKGLTTLDGWDNPVATVPHVPISGPDFDPELLEIFPWATAGESTKTDLTVLRYGREGKYYIDEQGELGAALIQGDLKGTRPFPETGRANPVMFQGDMFSFSELINSGFPGMGTDWTYQGFSRTGYVPEFGGDPLILKIFHRGQVAVNVRDVWGIADSTVDDDKVLPFAETPTGTHGAIIYPLVVPKDESGRWYNLNNTGWSPKSNICWDKKNQTALLFEGDSPAYHIGMLSTHPTFMHSSSISWIDVSAGWPSVSTPYLSFVEDAAEITGNRFVKAIPLLGYGADAGMFKSDTVRGKYTIDPFRRDVSRAAAFIREWNEPALFVHPLSPDLSEIRFRDGAIVENTATAMYAGRIWSTYIQVGTTDSVFETITYDGSSSNVVDVSTLVYFGQVTEDKNRALACHAQNDPTADIGNDPLDTDGGFVSIPEAASFNRLIPFKDSLLVFATNGVWQINGSESSFSATNQSVNKISSIGTNSPDSIVVTPNSVLYFGDAGIYSIRLEDISQKASASNISDNTISKLFYTYTADQRNNAIGTYDAIGSRVRWLITKEATAPYKDTEIVLDELTGAFTRYLFPVLPNYTFTDGGERTSPLPLRYHSTKYHIEGSEGERASSVRYLSASRNITTDDWDIHLLTTSDATFTDLEEWGGGADAESFLLTGYLTGGDTRRDKQANYITCSLRRTETGFVGSEELGWEADNPSSCFLQTQWEWTDSAGAGKWGRSQQVYRHKRLYIPEDPATDDWSDYAYTVINTRTKVRGQGKALSLLFNSESGKEMHIYGWATDVSMAENV